MQCSIPEIVKILLEYGADINVQDNKGKTAMMIASGPGYTEKMKFIFDYCAINSKDIKGKTLLINASY